MKIHGGESYINRGGNVNYSGKSEELSGLKSVDKCSALLYNSGKRCRNKIRIELKDDIIKVQGKEIRLKNDILHSIGRLKMFDHR
jgi:hypothetical protein